MAGQGHDLQPGISRGDGASSRNGNRTSQHGEKASREDDDWYEARGGYVSNAYANNITRLCELGFQAYARSIGFGVIPSASILAGFDEAHNDAEVGVQL